MSTSLRAALVATLKLAFPMMLGQAGQMVMILIDMYMVGKLGPQALGGAGLGSAIFYVFTLFGAGTLLGLDYLVSHAFGRDELDECHHWLLQSLYLVGLLSMPLVLVLEGIAAHFAALGYDAALTASASSFLRTLTWSLPPFLVFVAFRQYLQATDSVRPATVITLLAIVSNVGMNILLIFGSRPLHVPAMGVAGAGLATTVTRTLMALALVGWTLYRDHRLAWGLRSAPRRIHRANLWRLLALGAPAGFQTTLEAGVFSLATWLLSRLGVVVAAAHTVVVNITSFTYMIPMGISGAAAVLVGQAVGRNDPVEARQMGNASLVVSAAFMAASGLLLALLGGPICGLFSDDGRVVALGRALLLLVAVYQIADGLQGVAGGALRGLGDTRSAMVANLVGYWAVGLPLGWALCFPGQMGAVGFWLGITVGLFVLAAFVLGRWVQASRVPRDSLPD